MNNGQDAGCSWAGYSYRWSQPMRCTFRCLKGDGSGLAQDRLKEIFPEFTRLGRSPSLQTLANADPIVSLLSLIDPSQELRTVRIGVTLLSRLRLPNILRARFKLLPHRLFIRCFCMSPYSSAYIFILPEDILA